MILTTSFLPNLLAFLRVFEWCQKCRKLCFLFNSAFSKTILPAILTSEGGRKGTPNHCRTSKLPDRLTHRQTTWCLTRGEAPLGTVKFPLLELFIECPILLRKMLIKINPQPFTCQKVQRVSHLGQCSWPEGHGP